MSSVRDLTLWFISLTPTGKLSSVLGKIQKEIFTGITNVQICKTSEQNII